MTDKNALSIFNFDFDKLTQNLTIQTADGRTVELPENVGLTDLEFGGGEPLGQIKVGQPKDPNGEPFFNQLYYQKRERVTDEQSGQTTWTPVVYGPLGKALTVFPIGILPSHYTRSFMPQFDPKAERQEPLCRSENGIAPDAKHAGKLEGRNTICAVIDPRSGIRDVCPFAQWGEPDAKTGKKKPPLCGKQYVVAVAFSLENEDGSRAMVVAECYFKSASASEGKALVQELARMQRKNIPLYTLPVELRVKDAGIGNTFVPAFQAGRTLPVEQFSAEDVEGFKAATERWGEALRVRSRRAGMVDSAPEPANGGNGQRRPTVTVQAPADDEPLI